MALFSSVSQKCFQDDAFGPLSDDAFPLTTEEHQAYLAGQIAGKTIDFSTAPPTLIDRPAPPRAEVEADAWAGIKAERDKRTQLGGCQAQGHWFHSDTFSRSQWLGLKDQARDMLAAGGAMTDPIKKLGAQVYWKTMSGTFVAVTVQLAFDVVDATGNSDARVFTQAEVHRAAMVASTDPAAYDFSGGWPVNFEG